MKILGTLGKLTFGFFICLGFGACSQKILMTRLEPALITNQNIKYIKINSFKNDDINQSKQIYKALKNIKIKNKKYFNLVLENTSKSSENQKVKTILNGEVLLNSLDIYPYFKRRTDFGTCLIVVLRNGQEICIRFARYEIFCRKNTYKVKTKIEVKLKTKKISTSNIIFKKIYNASKILKHCEGDFNILPSKNEQNTILAQNITKQISRDLAPYYKSYKVKLLENLDLKISKTKEKKLKKGFREKIEKEFKKALKEIKNKNYKQAKNILEKLNSKTFYKSYAINYNLSLLEEYFDKLNKAQIYMQKASSLAQSKNKKIDEIKQGLKRLKREQKNKIILNKQIRNNTYNK